MNRDRFVIAIPHGRSVPPVIRKSAKLGDVCGEDPSIWTADGSREFSVGPHGRLIGSVFSAHTGKPIDAIPQIDLGSAEATASSLIRDYWGAYVAVLPDPQLSSIALHVAPWGQWPVYYTKTPTHLVFASEARLLEQAMRARLEVDWNALASFLRYPELRQRQSCLKGVDELAPGVLKVIGAHDLERQIWRAADYLPGADCPCFSDAAAELRELATTTCAAWADRFGSVAVASSGGVDSTFLAAALAAGERDFACVTLATCDSSGDESDYARVLADRLGVAFARRTYSSKFYCPTACASAGLPRPSRKGFLSAVDTLLADGAAELGRAVVLDGNGGDNLFCFLHSAAPVVDRLRNAGPRAALFETLPAMCRVTGCDIPTMLRATGRRLIGRRSSEDWAPDSRLLAERPDVGNAPEPLTPWHRLPAGRHPGKRDHLALIMRAQHHIHGFGPGPARFSPLMSQPLLEFCLGVPTWMWVAGGRNRALARAAFADLVPRSLVTRTSKAGPDSFIRSAFDCHREVFRELLLDGHLTKHGVVDRAVVEQAFALQTSRRGSLVYRLLDLVEAENWSRSWD